MEKCECCDREFPSLLMSDVTVFHREYCGKILVCDFCYRGPVCAKYPKGEYLRKDKGLAGLVRERLRSNYMKKYNLEYGNAHD
ncbi:hypothetical protein LCGC14_0624180 [marine sediment metagenome]|uniref:Uncharacterized protein n=1 Tax=marine sediment metagenome TaxID=412755 RepID=A0A0F9R439_9ZZZZ